MVSTVLVFGGFTLLLPVVPLRIDELGGGSVGAGAATALFMATTVATQLAVPWMLHTWGHRAVLWGGALLLGAPAALYPLLDAVAPVLAVTALRGVGFGMVTVAGSALIAELVPAAVLGRASSRYGVAVGLPQLATLPLGLAVVEAYSTTPVLLAGAVLPLVGLVVSLGLPGHTRTHGEAALPAAPTAGSTSRAVPVLALLALGVGALSFGASVTFLPLAVPGEAGGVGLALAVLTGALLVGRGVAGPLADRAGAPGKVLPAGAVLAGLGAAVLAVGVGQASPVLLVAGAAAFGAGFGLVQNDSLVLLFALAGPRRRGRASAAWNIAYDAGTGLGAAALGLLVVLAGYPGAFGVIAVVVAALGVALLARSAVGERR